MRIRCTAKGYFGLLVGLSAAAVWLVIELVVGGQPARGQESGARPEPPPPTEEIDVEQAVDFPYDI